MLFKERIYLNKMQCFIWKKNTEKLKLPHTSKCVFAFVLILPKSCIIIQMLKQHEG